MGMCAKVFMIVNNILAFDDHYSFMFENARGFLDAGCIMFCKFVGRPMP